MESRKIRLILNSNEEKGADYGKRKVNNEGIIFDYSNRGYHIRVENVKK